MRRVFWVALLAALIAVGTAGAGSAAANRWRGWDWRDWGKPRVHVVVQNADRCDPLGTGGCLYPYPNNYYTRRDPTTPTGLRLNLNPSSMPATGAGVHVDPTEWNRNDGFSPGQQIVVRIPGLDNQAAFDRTGLVPQSDIGESFARRQPLVLINAATGRRQPIWAELDSQATSDATRSLEIHPARNLREGARYIVALRNLKDRDGKTLAPSTIFRAYRDGLKTDSRAAEARRPAMKSIFRSLARAGIGRRDLYLAWDFTVASERSLSQRMLHIRNDAFAQLGDRNLADLKVQGSSPQFKVSGSQDFTAAQDPEIQRAVWGTVKVPCYLESPGCEAGSLFHYGADRLPAQKPGNFIDAYFRCIIPRNLPAGGGRALIYGHGLLGDPLDGGNSNTGAQGQLKTLAQDKGFVVCGTYWIGLSDAPAAPGFPKDIEQAGKAATDFSGFPPIVDRLQQGVLDYLYLGRAMIHPAGLGTDPAFRIGGQSVLKDFGPGRPSLFYDGNSEGGIEGGMLTAVAPDLNRSVLGVPGMDYPVLIQRSVDFAPFLAILNAVYPDQLERPLIYSLLGNVWDRGDPDGYAAHMTSDPYPNTPAHEVILTPAFGDHQVANVTALVEARTIGARVRAPILDPGRSTAVQPFFGIRRFRRYPFSGSALVMFDAGPLTALNPMGTPPAPDANVPPSVGQDPHEFPRRTQAARDLKDEFLRPGGRIETDPCAGKPCYANGYTGP